MNNPERINAHSQDLLLAIGKSPRFPSMVDALQKCPAKRVDAMVRVRIYWILNPSHSTPLYQNANLHTEGKLRVYSKASTTLIVLLTSHFYRAIYSRPPCYIKRPHSMLHLLPPGLRSLSTFTSLQVFARRISEPNPGTIVSRDSPCNDALLLSIPFQWTYPQIWGTAISNIVGHANTIPQGSWAWPSTLKHYLWESVSSVSMI